MAKRRKKKKSDNTGLLFFILIAVIVGGIIYNRQHPIVQKTYSDLSQSISGSSADIIPIAEFLASKQEITDAFGGTPQITNTPDLTWQKSDTQKNLKLELSSGSNTGALSLTVTRPDQTWNFSNVEFSVNERKQKVSGLYVSSTEFHAGSLTAPKLAKAEFTSEQDIFLTAMLEGITAGQKNYRISQTLKIYDQDNQLLAQKDDIARFESKIYQPKIPFTDKVGSLPAGTYYFELIFTDHNTNQTETSWQEIRVKGASKREPSVARITFASDNKFQRIKPDGLFVAGEAIHIKLDLAGFVAKDGKYAGNVAIKVVNGEGKILVNNGKFASFIRSATGPLSVSGPLKLNDPDVYLITFTIEDENAAQIFIRDTKVVVTLPKK